VQEIERLNPDVLVINDSPYVMSALPFINRAITRLPVLHSLLPWEMDLGLSNPQWWDRVIAVSQSVAGAVATRGLANRATVCLLGVPLPAATRQQTRRPKKSPLAVISVGRIVVQDKRMDRLPAIGQSLVRRKVDYHWTVLGDGEYSPTLRRELKRRGILAHFSLRGSVPASTVSQALARADVLVMPSDSEGTPHAVLEAMAHGVVPVVSRIAGSTTCIIEHRSSGFLCEPCVPAEFANAISDLASNAARRDKVGRNAAQAIAREFSLEAFAARFLSAVSDARAKQGEQRGCRPLCQISASEIHSECLGVWRCLRTETVGRLKRWWRGRRIAKSAEAGALLPSI
jgi:glycosyltransferase involved in cell wall biosynthesis